MLPPIPTAEILKAASTNINFISNIFSDIKAEIKNNFEVGLRKYLEDRVIKYGYTKTFMSEGKQIDFYDIYFPLFFNSNSKGENISSESLSSLIIEKKGCYGIIGKAGSGKTMLMKHFFLTVARTYFKIPIFIELRDLNLNEKTLIDLVFGIILNNNIKPNINFLYRALASGCFVFFLDGFDEISQERLNSLVYEIGEFIDKYNQNSFIISSRPEAGLENFPRFDNYYVSDLTLPQVFDFIDKQLSIFPDSSEFNARLNKTISNSTNSGFIAYIQIPLLLSMFIVTFSHYPELPSTKSKFYWNVFHTLTTQHDRSKKIGFTHSKKSNLSNDDLEKILKIFCFISTPNNIFIFDLQYLSDKIKEIQPYINTTYNYLDVIYDLTVSLSIIIQEGLDYKFHHRTMQDYLFVLFIKELPDEAKKDIYIQLFSKKFIALNNFNLFDLCKELDKINFYNYVLKYNLELFIENFNEKTPEENLLKLYSIKDAALKLTLNKTKNTITAIGFYYSGAFFIDVLEYLGISVNSIFHYSYIDEPVQDFILECISNKIFRITNDDDKSEYLFFDIVFNSIPNEISLQFINKYLSPFRLNEYIESVKQENSKISEELRMEKEKGNALLNLNNILY